MHVLITGASSGIGAALAREYARFPGALITLVARRQRQLAELADTLDCSTHVAVADVTEPHDGWLAEAIAIHGPVDVLVNNAGVQVIGPTHQIDVAAGERSVEVNLFAPLRLTRALLPAMIERGTGTIVNIASMAALAPTPSMTYYNASKAGIAAASEALRGELRGTGVRVMTVYPGIISETDLARRALATYRSSRLLGMQPTGTARELAVRVVRDSQRGRGRLIYPRVNALARWFPGTTRWIMDRFTPGLRGADAAGRLEGVR
jgi:short-subunit dehydrogenase